MASEDDYTGIFSKNQDRIDKLYRALSDKFGDVTKKGEPGALPMWDMSGSMGGFPTAQAAPAERISRGALEHEDLTNLKKPLPGSFLDRMYDIKNHDEVDPRFSRKSIIIFDEIEKKIPEGLMEKLLGHPPGYMLTPEELQEQSSAAGGMLAEAFHNGTAAPVATMKPIALKPMQRGFAQVLR